MSFNLLQRVKITMEDPEFTDVNGQQGIIVRMDQTPEDPQPSIYVQLRNGFILDDLFPSDIEILP